MDTSLGVTDAEYEELYAQEMERILSIIREAGQLVEGPEDGDIIQDEAITRLINDGSIKARCEGLWVTYTAV